MIIEALRHGRIPVNLTLTTKILREPESRGDVRMYVRLAEIKKALKTGAKEIKGYWVEPDEYAQYMTLEFAPSQFRIGCCRFTEQTFQKIVTAAKRAK